MIPFLLGIATFLSTLLGGLFALRCRDRLHLILGFSAGAVVGVAFFDLLPEAMGLVAPRYKPSTVGAFAAGGFLVYMLLNRVVMLHPQAEEDREQAEEHQSALGAGSLSIHSFLDGMAIGLGFQVSSAVGAIVAAAVMAHDFSDGINTVSFVVKNNGTDRRALRWLLVDALAPLAGITVAHFYRMSGSQLGLVLAVFCGCFLYIGASDLLPESQHRHPKLVTSLLTILGAAVIYGAVHLSSL